MALVANKKIFDIYYKEMLSLEILSDEEIKELIFEKDRDQNAFNILTEQNLKYVLFKAKKYMSRDIPFIDIVQAGNIGLCISLKKFNLEFGVKIITYADYWIRREILELIYSNKLIFLKEAGRRAKRKAIKKFKEENFKKIETEEFQDFKIFSIEVVFENDLTLLKDNKFEFIDNKALNPEEYSIFLEEINFLNRIKTIVNSNKVKRIVDNEIHLNVFKKRYGFSDGSFKPVSLREAGEIRGITKQAAQSAINNVWKILYKIKSIGIKESDRVFLYRILNISRKIKRKDQTHCVNCRKKLADLNPYNKCFYCFENFF